MGLNSEYGIKAIIFTIVWYFGISILLMFTTGYSTLMSNMGFVSYNFLPNPILNIDITTRLVISILINVGNYSIWIFGKIKEITIKQYESTEGREWRIKKTISD